MAITGLSRGPGCCSCLSCDRLSGSPRAPGPREPDQDSFPSGEMGSPSDSCSGSAGPPASAAAPPWVQVIGGLPVHGGSSSPLCPQSPSSSLFPGQGLKGKRKSVSPSLGTCGVSVLFSGSEVGDMSEGISDLGSPHSTPQPSLLPREQVLFSAFSLFSRRPGKCQGGLSQGQ